jgi:DNA-binding transcriptional LysR family regulator
MNLLHLQYFYTVAKEGGYTNASKVLRIQQPAISRMVKQLEESMEIELFERVGRQVKLTAQGKEVFERSKKIFEQVDDLKITIGQISGTPKGPLTFGASEAIAAILVPEALEKLVNIYPEIYPVVHSAPASMLFEHIRKGELEFGLFFHVPELPVGLKLTALKKIRFHLVVRSDLRRNNSTLESFIGSREVDDTRTRSFPTLQKLKQIRPKASIKISTNNLMAHLAMVKKGLGVSVLPDFLVKDDLKSGLLSDVLPKEKLEFDLKLVQREASVAGINAEAFLETIMER